MCFILFFYIQFFALPVLSQFLSSFLCSFNDRSVRHLSEVRCYCEMCCICVQISINDFVPWQGKKNSTQPKRIARYSLNAIRSGANMFPQSCLSEIENVKYPVWTFGHEKQNANYNLKLSQTKAHKNLINTIIIFKAIHLIFQQNPKTVKSIEWERTFAIAFALTNVNVHVDFSMRMNHSPKRVNWVWPLRIIFVHLHKIYIFVAKSEMSKMSEMSKNRIDFQKWYDSEKNTLNTQDVKHCNILTYIVVERSVEDFEPNEKSKTI